MELFNLTGKIAIITGGSQGIGFAITKGLATAGATVVIANRRVTEGKRAAECLQKEGLKAVAIPTDVTSISSITNLVSKALTDFEKIDILVNNAAIAIRKPVEDFTEEEWDRTMNTNLKGLFLCCQLVGKEMIRRNKGKIINISSVLSQIVRPGRTVYATTKAGVNYLTRGLALEWGKYNINVNAIAPGFAITEINKKFFEDNPEELKRFIDSTALGRKGYTEDYVGAAIFLASDASDFVTGQTLFVDGGLSLS